MSRKQFHKQIVNQSVKELFERFVASQTDKGVSDKTLETYHSHLHCIARYLDLTIPMDDLRQEDLEDMILSMRRSGLANNSISSYLRVFRTFLNWAKREGHTNLELPRYKEKETVKETYL